MMNARTFLVLSFALLLCSTRVTYAQFTSANADTLMNSFQANFYVSNGSGSGYYSAQYATSANTTGPGFWEESEEIEATEDAALRNSTYVPLVTSLLNGFLLNHGTTWTSDTYNDDMMWATIAFARGYQITGVQNFKTVAKANFDLAYARGWDTTNGGLWWNTKNNVKLACVEGPGSVAAYLIYQLYDDTSYQQKSLAIVQYEIANFYNTSNGAIMDNMLGTAHNVTTTYNQGIFIRATELNGYLSQASTVAQYLMTMGNTTPTSNGYHILNNYNDENNNSGFNSIAIRWAADYMRDYNLQGTYLAWLQANASAAWAVTDTSQELSWQDWHEQTPIGEVLQSWDCISSVDALQVVPSMGSVDLQISMALTTTGIGYTETLTVTNKGTAVAPTVQVTSATLGSAAGTTLPALLGDLQPNQAASVTLTFAASAGMAGLSTAERVAGTYSGGTFGGTLRTTLP